MISKKMLLTMYQYSYFLVEQAIDVLTHERSLIKPPRGDNPANWILGHILASRANIQAMLDVDPVWDFHRCTPYLPDSEPLGPKSQMEDFPIMVADLESTQEKLIETIGSLTSEQLREVKGENSLGEELTGYAIHEAYHAGELAMLCNWLE